MDLLGIVTEQDSHSLSLIVDRSTAEMLNTVCEFSVSVDRQSWVSQTCPTNFYELIVSRISSARYPPLCIAPTTGVYQGLIISKIVLSIS